MSKKISLTQGMVTVVDDEDFAWLSQWKWYAKQSRSKWYAARTIYENQRAQILRMQRIILNAPSDLLVDHVNGDSLDNRRSNLRLVTHQENQWNSEQSMGVGTTDPRKTICVRQRKGMWYLQIGGMYQEEAAAYALRDELVALLRQAMKGGDI